MARVTAIIVLSILALIAFLLIVSAIGYLKQFKVKAVLEQNKVQRSLILDIEHEAIQFGYADPLASIVLNKIHTTRKEENK